MNTSNNSIDQGKRFFLVGIVLLSIMGVAFSYELLSLHYIKNETSWLASNLCGKTGTFFDCGKVNNSSIARIFGVPLALYGLFFYLVFFLFLFQILAVNRRQGAFLLVNLLWILAIGALADLFLLVYSLFFVKSICPLCLITYFITWISLILVFMVTKSIKKEKSIPLNPFTILNKFGKSKKNIYSLPKFILSLTIPIFLSATMTFFFNQSVKAKEVNSDRKKLDQKIAEFLDKYEKEFKKNINLSPYPWLGGTEAPVTMVEFSDFMCPYCARLAPALKNLIKQNKGSIRLKFMNLPLDKSCNKYMKKQLHHGSCEMAKGAICADKQGRFWVMHDLLFSLKKHKISRKDILSAARTIDLKMAEFSRCMSSRATQKQLESEIEEAEQLEISGTPTVYINGKKAPSIHPLILNRIIDLELNKK